MMRVTRRVLVLGTSAVAIAAALSIRALRPAEMQTVALEPEPLLSLVRREFGPSIAGMTGARSFAEDLAARPETEMPEDLVVIAFIRATTVIRAMETGDDLVYVGLEELHTSPCRNTLSVNWL